MAPGRLRLLATRVPGHDGLTLPVMDRYRVVATLSLFTGSVVGLSEAQHEPRESHLHARGDGVYEVTAPVQFKAGEELGVVDAPKALLGSVMVAADVAETVPTAVVPAAAPTAKPARKRVA